MADNTLGGSQDAGDPLIATDEVTYSGDTADVQLMRPVHVTGAEGSKTVVDLTNDDGSLNVTLIDPNTGDPAPFTEGGVLEVFMASLVTIQGNDPHDAPDEAYPVKIGGYAKATAPTAVSDDGDRVNAWYDLNGRAAVFDGGGNLSIDDGGNSITVDGSVTANAGTNLNTSLLATESGGNLAGAATSLAVMDDWDESDRAKVNPIAGQAGVQGASGVVTALTQRVVLATDVALPAGTNAIGKLAANSGVDIGDVTVDNGSGASAVNVQDGGNSLTVDGTVTAVSGTAANLKAEVVGTGTFVTQSVVTNGGTFAVQADTELTTGDLDTGAGTDTRAVVGLVGSKSGGGELIPGDTTNGLDVDVTRLPALVASSANIGDVDVLTLPNVTLAAGTNTNEIVGDAAHDAPAAGNPVLNGGYAKAAAPTDVSADADVVNAWFLRNGAQATVLTAGGALVGGDATNGLDVDVTRMSALVASSANIGDVDVLTLPALVASSANIGDVDVLTLPADPLGANADAIVAAGAVGSISAKLRRTTQGLEDLKTSIVLAAGSAAIGKLAANSGVDIGDVDVTSISAGDNNIGNVDIVTLPNVSTATLTNVNDSGSSVQLLASTATRKGCLIHNDSTTTLYVKFGTTASLTDYSVKLPPDAQWAMIAPIYTGRLDGIWSADASGAARITEL